MTSISWFAVRLSGCPKDKGLLFMTGRQWLKFSFPAEVRLRRGVTTDASSADLNLNEDEEDQNISAKAERLKKIKDISGLTPWHRNVVNKRVPSEEKIMPWHFTVLYNKRMFGRYGYASGVNPSLCWPTKEELADKRLYEEVAYPYTILEVAERAKAKLEAEQQRVLARDKDVSERYEKMLIMKEDFIKKKQKQAADIIAAKAFKTRLLEEVRLHFNYTINERDERFQLELKERAKQLKEKEKLQKKSSKKEKMAMVKAANFELQVKKLKEEEDKRAALKSNVKEEQS